MADRFYVYRFNSPDGFCAYIGKGSGRRFEQQSRRFGLIGGIVAWFCSERDAYKREIRLIETMKPALNQNRGGGGQWVRKPAPRQHKYAWEREMDRIGTRCYAARALLRLDTRGFLTDQQRDALRAVASQESRDNIQALVTA